MSSSAAPPAQPAGESRLDRMIARLSMQRACLDHAAALIADVPGPVLEVGLGKGRTFDHLRRRLPEREIFALDREMHALPGCAPDAAHLVVGEFFDTLARLRGRLAGRVALAHADFGTEDPAADAAQARWLGPLLDRLMAPDGLVLSDRALAVRRWTALPVPEGGWPYHLWRVGPAPA